MALFKMNSALAGLCVICFPTIDGTNRCTKPIKLPIFLVCASGSMASAADPSAAAAANAGGGQPSSDNGASENGGDNDTCLQLALEGEKLCKAGNCRDGVAFFEAALQVITSFTTQQ